MLCILTAVLRHPVFGAAPEKPRARGCGDSPRAAPTGWALAQSEPLARIASLRFELYQGKLRSLVVAAA